MLPQWLIVALLAPLLLFPLTLAYVIVVEKAMDVSVVLRQGLQYVLARTGTRVIQALMVGVVIFALAAIAVFSNSNPEEKLAVIAIGVAMVFTIRRAGDRLRAWIDRRFFREAYDAEQVLTELSEQVRSIVENRSLETVATRISETLHVPQVAVLLGTAASTGPPTRWDTAIYPMWPSHGEGHRTSAADEQKEPARVYLNDRDRGSTAKRSTNTSAPNWLTCKPNCSFR